MQSILYLVSGIFGVESGTYYRRRAGCMSVQGMSQTRRRAWSVMVIWTLAGAGFFLAFFSGGGAGEFDTDSARHLGAAAAVGFGFLGWWGALWLTRSREGEILTDERDLQVMARAGHATLVVVLMVIFAGTVSLWTIYEEAGSVPVGWLWFIAYGAVILAVVANSLLVLVLERKTWRNG